MQCQFDNQKSNLNLAIIVCLGFGCLLLISADYF